MKALTYLLLTIIKNALLELRKKPGQLIFLLVMVGLMAFVFVTGQQVGVSEQVRDPRELSAILLSLYLFLFVIAVLQGLSSGATFYSMADVNLLFQTPIAPRRILLYGLIRQMGTSLLVGVFLLFQYTTFHVQYGVTIGGLLLILLTYGVTSFQLALASPAAEGGMAVSVVKFLGVFAPTQLPLAVLEGILTVVVMIALESYARPELRALGFEEG